MQARPPRQSQSRPRWKQLVQRKASPAQALPKRPRQRFPSHHLEKASRICAHLAFPDQHAVRAPLIHENTEVANKASVIDCIAALRQASEGVQVPANLIMTHSDYTISTNQRDSFLVM